VHLTVEERELVCESELIAGSAYRWIATCVLELFRLHGDRTTRTATAAALLAGYRRAIRFIDDYASLPITVDDIAEAAGLPTRQLDAAFRWHSPTGGNIRDELRRARLDAAHRDLLAGDPTRGDTVRDIALRWGFRPGTFAQEYRNQFGRNPRWVLDR
jgi:transcriptional regulator GlxA family with amidase domain